ncbi:MAG TPA: AMIN domain-containing protein, partial [Terriglobales bacterium]|nr:AMIN domain-containing protein [Terriglobales bacterium]
MRKQLLGLLVPLLAFVVITIAAAADTTGKEVAAGARLQRLEVAHSQDGLRIEFKAKGALAPKLSTLESPARIVVDFPNTVMATAQSHIVVDRDGVKDVRIGMDGQVPPSTHVVIDLADGDRAASRQHELVAGPEGSFVLKIHEAALAHRQPAPAVKSPAASQAPQRALASAPVTLATTSTTTSATAVAPAPASAENAGKPAADFAFVEPKFSPKAAEPVAKAQEAASRFADNTAAELVATNTNAALGQAGSNKPTIQPAVNLAAEQKAQLEQKPAVNGAKYTGEPISVNLKDVDLKDFFRLIHEISGLNVVLDPMIHGNLTIVLDDVPWDQALDIV